MVRRTEAGRVQTVLRHQRAPRADAGQQTDDDGWRVLARCRLKCLRDDHHADPQDDRHTRVDWDRPGDPRECARHADRGHEGAVQNRVAGPGAERLPSRMSDVDRRREGRSEQRGRDRTDAVHGQRESGVVRIPGGFGRLDVLQRPEHVEEPHRDDHREIRQQVAPGDRGHEIANDRNRQVERRASGMRSNRCDSGYPAEQCANRNRHHASGEVPLEADAAEVGQHHDAQRREADHGPRERAEEKAEGDEAERDAGERREQRRAWGRFPDPLGDHRAGQLDHA